MIHTLENSFLKSKKTGNEYMWDANPEIWKSFAPVLFPIIGALKNNCYTYKGNKYSIPKHGFIRNNSNLEIESKTSDTLTLKYKYNEETLKMYPFMFVFSISFHLHDNTLTINQKIENLGKKEMLFSIGAHPAFKCPIQENQNYEDYYIEFEEKEIASTWELAEGGLTSGKTHLVLHHTNKLPLTKSLFNSDALIFKNLKSKKVCLKNLINRNNITIHFTDFNYLGIWAKPNASFVCIEPWLGITDDVNCTGKLENKEGMIKLEQKKTFTADYSIEIDEG